MIPRKFWVKTVVDLPTAAPTSAVVYDATLPNDPLVCLVNFGADYSSANGTFTITWNASGIWTLDLTP